MVGKLSIKFFSSFVVGRNRIFQFNKTTNEHRLVSASDLNPEAIFLPVNTFKAKFIVGIMLAICCIIGLASYSKIGSTVIMSTAIDVIDQNIARNLLTKNPSHNYAMQAQFSLAIEQSFFAVKLTNPIAVISGPIMLGEKISIDVVKYKFHGPRHTTVAVLSQEGVVS